MYFLGDIAVPDGCCFEFNNIPQFNDECAVANLEGLIADFSELESDFIVANGSNVIEYLKRFNVKAVSLANNHVNDAAQFYDRTQKILTANGIQSFGAGKTVKEAAEPVLVEENSILYALLGFGWKVIGCDKHGTKQLFINQLTFKNVEKCIANTRKKYSNARIIPYFHWNYELELYPQPMHRVLAKKALEWGAYAVIGGHSHCVQSIEIYSNKPIVYCLGNFLMPNAFFFKGKLKYPILSRDQMVFSVKTEDFKVYQYYYNQNNTISYCGEYSIEKIDGSFGQLNDKEYIRWFRKNRRKKKLLPIYISDNSIVNELKDKWVLLREKGIKILLHLGIKKSPK